MPTNSPTSTEQVIEMTGGNAREVVAWAIGAETSLETHITRSRRLKMADRVLEALEALPPKPVDGEVAELAERLRNDVVGLHNTHPAVETMIEAADMLLALSRNTEPMVTDARRREEIISAWAFAHNIDGAARNDLFARLSAGKKGTDDD